ncbi:MAG TPA: DUF3047 domain-containing protein [Burkholderiales bacterium]|jgi:hypothetical protein|nr:DUF3047 domain-containing protein [Burkholderiales bacterium]
MPFSSLKPGAALPDWLKPVTFWNRPRHTEFTLVADQGGTVLRARANASTSGLARELAIDPRRTPLLAWRWKVMSLISKSDMASKEGDDFPARLYVTFDNPRRSLCYVWDARRAVGTIAANAYSERVQMVVAASGAAQLARWVTLERDWTADYRRAFGAQAPAADGVVVSADTDNTGESAESYFGDVVFRSRPTS